MHADKEVNRTLPNTYLEGENNKWSNHSLLLKSARYYPTGGGENRKMCDTLLGSHCRRGEIRYSGTIRQKGKFKGHFEVFEK